MDPVEKMHLDSLVNNNTYDIWHIGLANSIDVGLKNLYKHLSQNDEILIEITDMFDYSDLGQLYYFCVYRALPKLEYLEYMWQKKVDNYGKTTL